MAKRKSIEIKSADRLSQRGSFRIAHDELSALGLPAPRAFSVPANTLVVADMCGFHARGNSNRQTLRIELWAYCRRTPFLPWTGLDVLSSRVLAVRRTEWLGKIMDRLDRLGLAKQHWKRAGRWGDVVGHHSRSIWRMAGTPTAHQIAPNTAMAAVTTNALS